MSFCDYYNGTGITWPIQGFPKSFFPHWSGQRLAHASKAWNFFELVEAKDANTRYTLSQTGNVTANAPWFPLRSEGDRILYKEGKTLHQQLCPNVTWTSQRILGLSSVPLTNVYPAQCPPSSSSLSGVGPCATQY